MTEKKINKNECQKNEKCLTLVLEIHMRKFLASRFFLSWLGKFIYPAS
jgi:hypothetical protein